MRGTSKTASQSRELLRSLKRYYSNAVSDPEKQDAINLFLGHFVPQHDKADVWELDSDYFLHCGVDWEKQNLTFTSESNLSLNPGPSQPQTHKNTAHKSGNLEFFPVPVISQAGGPEEPISSDQATKKDAGPSGWSLNFWFRSLKDTTAFQLPDAKGPLLDSFEEMLSINPIIEVRLHDGEMRRQKDGQGLAFQKTFARLLTQETATEQGSGALNVMEGDVLSGVPCTGCHSRSSSMKLKANSAIQVLRSPTKLTTMSDRPIRSTSKTSQEFRSLQNHSTFGMVETFPRPKSEMQVHRRTWFGGLGRRTNEGRNLERRSASASAAALRTLSTPAEVEKCGYHHLGQNSRSAITAGSDPVEEFWNEYWSITEQSLMTEFTLAEKVSKASNKREAVRLARASKSSPSQTHVGKLTAVNMFLDNLLDQYLDKSTTGRQTRLPDRLTEDVTRKTQAPFEGVKSDGDASHQTELDMRSNINQLLFCSATGPGDRVLEKWFLADKSAEEDYHRNLTWIKTLVEPTAFGPIEA